MASPAEVSSSTTDSLIMLIYKQNSPRMAVKTCADQSAETRMNALSDECPPGWMLALISACAVASGVAVELIACQAGPTCAWSRCNVARAAAGNQVDIPPGGVGGADREQASLTQQPAAGSGQGVSVMMRS